MLHLIVRSSIVGCFHRKTFGQDVVRPASWQLDYFTEHDMFKEQLELKENGEALHVMDVCVYYDQAGGGASDVQERRALNTVKWGTWEFAESDSMCVSFTRVKTVDREWSCSEGSPYTPKYSEGDILGEIAGYDLNGAGGLQNWNQQAQPIDGPQTPLERFELCSKDEEQ